MKTYTCDRCGEIIRNEEYSKRMENGPDVSIIFRPSGYKDIVGGSQDRLDLCPNCLAAFLRFMDMEVTMGE